MLMRAVLDRSKKVIDTPSCLSIHSKECDDPVMLHLSNRPAGPDLIPSQTGSSRRLCNGNCSRCDDGDPVDFALGSPADASGSNLHRLGGMSHACLS
jgi:hypothetical protein